MSDVKKYVVTEKHTLNHKVGDVIELTESAAAKLVNKITPAKVEEKPVKAKSQSKRLNRG